MPTSNAKTNNKNTNKSSFEFDNRQRYSSYGNPSPEQGDDRGYQALTHDSQIVDRDNDGWGRTRNEIRDATKWDSKDPKGSFSASGGGGRCHKCGEEGHFVCSDDLCLVLTLTGTRVSKCRRYDLL